MFVKIDMEGDDRVRALFARVPQVIHGNAAKEAAGNGVRKKVISHLEGLGPNKRFPEATTGFYKEAAESVSVPVPTAEGAEIDITKTGMAQRFFGGVIKPGPGKTYLTEPGAALSYGRLAPEWSGLEFAYAMNEEGFMAPALVATDRIALSGQKKRRKGQRPPFEVADVVYWLIKQANQQPDPTVLPTEQEMADAAVAELGDYIRAWLHDPYAEVSTS